VKNNLVSGIFLPLAAAMEQREREKGRREAVAESGFETWAFPFS